MKYAKWRQRLRGMCKWGGVTLCVLLFALWLASGWYYLAFDYVDPEETDGMFLRDIGVMNGSLVVVNLIDPNTPPRDLEWQFVVRRWTDALTNTPSQASWTWWWWSWGGLPPIIGIPLWLPFLLTALPTGFLFWSDHRRRMRADCCDKCGYDLTGNTTGRCPECGAEAAKKVA